VLNSIWPIEASQQQMDVMEKKDGASAELSSISINVICRGKKSGNDVLK